MDISHLKECLTKGTREELFIPFIDATLSVYLLEIATWAMEGSPVQGRRVFFCIANAKDLQNQLPPHVRHRIVPIRPERNEILFKRGPFDALLLPENNLIQDDPNRGLSSFWVGRGAYEKCEYFRWKGWKLWFWKSFAPPLRFFGLDHHHAVLWDMKQILRPLGIHLDFTWLCDGRPSVNEAIPSQEPPFFSSLDIYKKPVDEKMDATFKERILSRGYDAILTSHSLVTAYRLRDLGLPIFHVNSTRFGNEWILDPEKHRKLVDSIHELLQKGHLYVLHNNRGDEMYFRQFFPYCDPNQTVYVPSLCEGASRLRNKSVESKRFLIWDTRQVLIKPNTSPFMKEFYMKLRGALGDCLDSQAILLAQTKNYLPEGYLDNYTAVIHLPYNISTMSIFEQTRANIPVWVPSPTLLEKLWNDPNEPNELSWTLFAPGKETNASCLDKARNPEAMKAWLAKADFYHKDTMGCICLFDSIEDLIAKITTLDYEALISENESLQEYRRMEVFSVWDQVFQGLRLQKRKA